MHPAQAPSSAATAGPAASRPPASRMSPLHTPLSPRSPREGGVLEAPWRWAPNRARDATKIIVHSSCSGRECVKVRWSCSKVSEEGGSGNATAIFARCGVRRSR